MGDGALAGLLIALRAMADLFWTLTAWALDATRQIGPLKAGAVIAIALGSCWVVAGLMQRRLNDRLSASPDEPVSMIRQELLFTLPGLVLTLLTWPIRAARRALTRAREARAARKKAEAAQTVAAGDAAWRGVAPQDAAAGVPAAASSAPAARAPRQGAGEQQEDEAPPGPVLVATLGPSFVIAALIVAALYAIALLTAPLLRLQLGLSEGAPAWQYLIFGQRSELQWYLPLSRYPWQGALLIVLWWSVLWWWIARGVRLVLLNVLGHNLVARRDDATLLSSWREIIGLPYLWQLAPTAHVWAQWLPIAAAPFLIWGWMLMATDPYRMSPSLLSVALLTALSWGLLLTLKGLERLEEREEAQVEPVTVVANAWPQVLKDLQERFQIRAPHLFTPPQPVEALAHSSVDPAHEGVVSPLLVELLPAPQQLTPMQHTVLRQLSLLGYVHTDPPTPRGELALSGSAATVAREGKHRHQIIIAPEGAGKTTLAILAACNQALIHTRGALLITRDQASADRLFAKLRGAIEPSTLRWNVRERRVGADLVNDLSQGIVPDVVVCSLHQVAVNLLDEPQTYAPFLQNLGLILIDDVEALCGSVEIHAQLILRRLILRTCQLQGVSQLGEESAPLLAMFGADTMHDTPAWARALCGSDAAASFFDYSNREATEREAALLAQRGQQAMQGQADAMSGRFQLVMRLGDLRNADDEVLTIRDVIESCERCAVPWHYRPCGDEHRHLGRARLRLRDEPRQAVHDPGQAGVIVLQGCYAEVQRELGRLSRAGVRFNPVKRAGEGADASPAEAPSVPIAIITVIDRDEEMALTELNPQSSLYDALRTLPRPIVRPPTGDVVLEHLAAELTTSWIEVRDALDIFGNAIAPTLTRLADAGVLMSEERVDLRDDIQAYEPRVYLRATSRAVGGERVARGARAPILPGRVTQVELHSGQRVAVRDRTSLNAIDVADEESASHIFYLGRIFENAQGRFVVVGRAGDERAAEEGRARDGERELGQDVLVEPYLNEGISSPRRRTRVRYVNRSLLPARQGAPRTVEELLRELDESHRPPVEPVLIGRFPVGLALTEVVCTTEHIATFRLGPDQHEVRQRIVFDPGARKRHQRPLRTQALAIYPNPDVASGGEEEAPKLALDEARLIAAAMRAVLPSMYRSAASSLEVELLIHATTPNAEHVLRPGDGFLCFDTHPGGNGASRALYRDGVELLLRLCRVYIERVLYHDRLRARYDYWGDEAEILAGEGGQGQAALEDVLSGGDSLYINLDDLDRHLSGDPTAAPSDAAAPGGLVRSRDREARRKALIWLDSRLRPEGSLSGGRTLGKYGSGEELGEGDLCDIGRCWYSQSGAVTELVWAKHRWQLDEDGAEAMLDVGFDRDTAAASRFHSPEHEAIAPLMAAIVEQLENPVYFLPDETPWGAPAPLWWAPQGQPPVASAEAVYRDPAVGAFHQFLGAVAAHDFDALKPLADLLADRSGAGDGTVERRWALICYMSKFVQGIPSAPPSEVRGGDRPPVHALLHRLGDCDAKSLILAILLRHCGLETGLFVSLEGRDAMAAVSALVLPGVAPSADGAQSAQALASWRQRVGLRAQEDMAWGEVAARPGSSEAGMQVMIPIDLMHHDLPGQVRLEAPEGWVFLPLSAVWYRLGAGDEDAGGAA